MFLSKLGLHEFRVYDDLAESSMCSLMNDFFSLHVIFAYVSLLQLDLFLLFRLQNILWIIQKYRPAAHIISISAAYTSGWKEVINAQCAARYAVFLFNSFL